MSQCACVIKGRRYILDLEPAEFDWQFTRGTKGERVLLLSWLRQTQFENIVALTLVTIRLKWPFITIIRCTRDIDEPEEEEELK
jgi:hypothetical protein